MDLADARRAPGGGGRSLGARPLQGYFIVMVAVIAATYLLIPLLSKWAGVETGSGIGWVLANKTILFTVAFGMAGFLVVPLRQKPKEVFLTPGDLRAPTSVRLPGMRRPLHWGALGTTATVLLFTGFATQMWLDGAFLRTGSSGCCRWRRWCWRRRSSTPSGRRSSSGPGPSAFSIGSWDHPRPS